jgi:iron complex outermembrane receptor protein
VVRAYEQNRRLRDIPAAVGYLNARTIESFGSLSLVQAINTLPGVRMEERSPGSYRLNIRGSALRSPFGVRNVKVYYNDLPFTHPGGHTYLNQLGAYNFGTLEVIKGPGSSLYGAGTGGVLLAQPGTNNDPRSVTAEYTRGSYGMQNAFVALQTDTGTFRSKISFQHQASDGYRIHSALERDVFSWTSEARVGSQGTLKTTFLYGDLFYQTPGALTKAEYEVNPRNARPGNAAFPGAEAAQASVRQRTVLAGASYATKISSLFHNTTALYGAYTQLLNPAIQNYGRISEPHFGGRSTFVFEKKLRRSVVRVHAGAEWQQGSTIAGVHRNRGGAPDSLMQSYEVSNRQSLLFTQITIEAGGFTAVAGASLNELRIKYQNFLPRAVPTQEREFRNILAPRLALFKKLGNTNIYTSIARGFSPPSTEEFFPSGSVPNIALNAEEGVNYDVGLRTRFRGLNLDVNLFHFSLQNSIVQLRTAGGGSQFVNAGSTVQKGIETSVSLPLLQGVTGVRTSSLWLSHALHHFRYRDFTKDTVDLTGKQLPGVPPHTLSAGFQVTAVNGLLLGVSYLYNDRAPLTDANAVYSTAFSLLGGRVGYERMMNRQWRAKLIVGADNLLDEDYSLGNDINGFGGRYFNAAPGRNYYVTLALAWQK